jgi:glucosyl-3-phosphoglycerate synthase
MFLPELTAIIQPLSGQCAIRREVLERIPFPIGYGIEIANLIDVYHQFGLEAFGQTHLGTLVHRNHSTRDLGKMAFGILHTFHSRISPPDIEHHRSKIESYCSELHQTLHQFRSTDTSLEQVDYTIPLEERPPMITLPAYRKKFDV